jgi:hypothetical protein
MKTGDLVEVKEGASIWMKNHNYWLDSMGESIDGKIGRIVDDYTGFSGNDSHFGVDLGFENTIGVNPKFLKIAK